jgi:hypothetical protein
MEVMGVVVVVGEAEMVVNRQILGRIGPLPD